MSLSLLDIKNTWIPFNVYNRPNNLQEAQAGVSVYNKSINLYESILLATAAITTYVDLTPTFTTTTAVITPSTGGAAATITAATTLQAGVMTSTNVINLNALMALDGVAPGATNLGTFSGNIISDNTTIKNALQELEIAIETAGSPTLGDVLSSTLTITSGTNRVYGGDVTIELDPSTIDIGDLSGTIDLTQFPSGTTAGQFIIWTGSEWVITTPSLPSHNSLSGIQGGVSSERYHLGLSLYTKLTASPTNRLIGRSTAGTGEVEAITPTHSIVLSGGSLTLANDSASPGNSKFYGTDGSGVKGWYTLSNGTLTSVSGVDNDDTEWTITNPTTTPALEVNLVATGVTAGSYGTASSVGTFTVDANGRLLSANNTAIQITTSQITSFTPTVQSTIATSLVAGSGISIDDTDPSAIEISATATPYTDENAQDAVGSILLDTTDIDFTYDDATPNISATLTTTGVNSGTYGSSINVPVFTVNSKGRLTAASSTAIAIPSTAVTDFSEAVDDRVSQLLVAGSGITLNYNDVAGTLTIAAGAGSGYNIVQSMGVSMPQQPILNFNTNGFQVANDGPNTRTNVGLTSNLAQIGVISTGGFFMRDLGGAIETREIISIGNGIQIGNGNGFVGNPSVQLNLIGGFQNLQSPPGGDRIFFYDHSAGISTYLQLGASLSITGTTLDATFSGTLNDLSDVVITSPTTKNVLYYNGTNWVNYTPPYVEVVGTPSNGDEIYWDGTNWVPITEVINVQIGLTGNTVTLPSTPVAHKIPKVFFNGALLEEGSDYTRSGVTLTFIFSFLLTDKVTTIYYIL